MYTMLLRWLDVMLYLLLQVGFVLVAIGLSVLSIAGVVVFVSVLHVYIAWLRLDPPLIS